MEGAEKDHLREVKLMAQLKCLRQFIIESLSLVHHPNLFVALFQVSDLLHPIF
jgi:hypothetical protein